MAAAAAYGHGLTGDPGGDTGVYVWNQWVFQHEALVGRHNPLRTTQILSLTDPVDLSQHNYTAFLNLLALPLIPWLGVVATFNVVLLLATVLTALATYALVRRVTPRRASKRGSPGWRSRGRRCSSRAAPGTSASSPRPRCRRSCCA